MSLSVDCLVVYKSLADIAVFIVKLTNHGVILFFRFTSATLKVSNDKYMNRNASPAFKTKHHKKTLSILNLIVSQNRI